MGGLPAKVAFVLLLASPAAAQQQSALINGAPWQAEIVTGYTYTDEERAGYEAVYDQVHAAVRDEDFVMLPSCGDGVRNAQHDHMLIGRNEIGVQHMVRTLAADSGVELG